MTHDWKARRVKGELLVRPAPGKTPADLDAAIRKHGAKVRYRLPEIDTYVIVVDEAKIQTLADELIASGVASVAEPHHGGSHGAAVTPNDSYYGSQWHLQKVDCPDAWGIAEGTSWITIGHIDSGVDPTHPDLAPNLIAGFSWLPDGPSSDTHDRQGHGTATAGTVNAVTNNATGVAGVAWNCRLMPLVVLDGSDFATWAHVASAMIYAADHGCKVITCSIVGTSGSSTLQSGVTYAKNKGVLVVCCAGNNASQSPAYPAAYADLSAGATDESDNRASFSNFGPAANIYAPGTNIMTTNNGGGYGGWQGTSFSAPIVAGVACLMLSANSLLTRPTLASMIMINSDPTTPGPRVDAFKATQAAKGGQGPDVTAPVVTISNPANGSEVSGTSVVINASATDKVGVAGMTLKIDGAVVMTTPSANIAFTWNLPHTTHTITATASDAAGNVGTTTITVTV